MEGIAGDHAALDDGDRALVARGARARERELVRPAFLRAQVGFNNNVKYKNQTFHIQTEDSGLDKPHVITHLFADGGRVIKSHKRSYAEHVERDDVAPFVRQLMKGQQLEMALALREGRFDPVIEGRAMGGMEVLDYPPKADVQKLATKKKTRVAGRRRERSRVVGAGRAPTPPAAAAPRPSASTSGCTSCAASAAARTSTSRKGTEAIIGSAGAHRPAGRAVLPPARGARSASATAASGCTTSRPATASSCASRRPWSSGAGDEFIVGDQLLRIERNPDADDGPDPGPTYFYSSPKWLSSFRVVQIFEGGALGACVLARGTTLQIGSSLRRLRLPERPARQRAALPHRGAGRRPSC